MAKHKRKPPPKKRPAEFQNNPLASLSKLKPPEAEAKRSAPPPSPTPQPKPEENDDLLFRAAMGDIAPLPAHHDQLPPPPQVELSRPASEQEHEEVMQTLRDLVDGELPFSIQETGEAIEGAVQGMDPRVLRRLRKGEFSIQDHLDLHGYNWSEAKEKVEAFLFAAATQGKRCVLIIHGKGLGSKDHEPVLKNHLTNWFFRAGARRGVLAFATARPCDGGAGAVYVLLRKPSRMAR